MLTWETNCSHDLGTLPDDRHSRDCIELQRPHQRGTTRDDVQGFDTKWSEVLLSIHEMPSDSILKNLYRTQLTKSDIDLLQKDLKPSYQKLKIKAKKFLDQKSKARNF